MGTIRVLLVDDHRVVVQGIHAILDREPDLEVVGEATTGEEALQLVEKLSPDLVVTDVVLRGLSGSQLTQATKSRWPNVRVLALTIHAEDECVSAMIQAGVDGYVLKSISAPELVNDIRVVAQGQVLYPSSAKKLLAAEYSGNTKPHPSDLLTEREREILRLIATGATSREIARQLFLSSKTVDNHRARILEKLQVRNKAEAVAHAIRAGFLAAETVEWKAPVVQLMPSGIADGKRAPRAHREVPTPPAKRYNEPVQPKSPRNPVPRVAGSEAI